MSESVLTRCLMSCLNMSDCDVWALEKLGGCAIGAVLPTHENELYHDHGIQYRLRVQRADHAIPPTTRQLLGAETTMISQELARWYYNTICMVGLLNTQKGH
ncbi:hypothetical protein N7527_000346 [Penicillium freii]|nr:hypothetical protein N7527_000346 [Penicillium freii]